MKRINLFLIVVMMAMVSSFSCTRKADIVLPPHTPSLVLHSYVNVGEKFAAVLGKTIRMDVWVVDTATYVNTGWMALFENGILIDSLKYDATLGYYVTDNAMAEAGKTYTIKAGAKGFNDIEATAVSPFPVDTKSIYHLRNSRTDVSGQLLDDIVFSFEDPVAEKNYYLAALYPAFPGMNFVCVYTYDPSIEKYTEALLPFDQNNCIGSQEILFNDKAFNGKLKQITLSANSYSLHPYPDPFSGDTLKPVLKRYNITEDYYRYFKQSSTLSLNAGGPTLTDPVIIRGNVKNGFGLFTIYAAATDTLP